MNATKGFYTYLWLREDGTPYYVGKGSGKRAIRKGSPPLDRILIQEFPSEPDAFAAERFLIAYYGRKDIGTGILRNRTDGGDGMAGCFPSEDTRKKMRQSRALQIPPNLGRKLPPLSEARRKHLSESMRGKPSWIKGKQMSAAGRQRLSEAKRGKRYPKLSEAKSMFSKSDVETIMRLRNENTLLQDIASQFSVHRQTISNVLRGRGGYGKFVLKQEAA